MRETIKEFSGRVIGYLDYSSNGDITVRDFSGVVLGYYYKSRNATCDFYGRVLYFGNMASALLIL